MDRTSGAESRGTPGTSGANKKEVRCDSARIKFSQSASLGLLNNIFGTPVTLPKWYRTLRYRTWIHNNAEDPKVVRRLRDQSFDILLPPVTIEALFVNPFWCHYGDSPIRIRAVGSHSEQDEKLAQGGAAGSRIPVLKGGVPIGATKLRSMRCTTSRSERASHSKSSHLSTINVTRELRVQPEPALGGSKLVVWRSCFKAHIPREEKRHHCTAGTSQFALISNCPHAVRVRVLGQRTRSCAQRTTGGPIIRSTKWLPIKRKCKTSDSTEG